MYSFTEENYLKAILKLSPDGQGVNTNALAEEISTKPASVTDMLKKLSEKDLVNYEKYKGVSLTTKGKKIALQVVRKHRLWETFLHDKLSFGWEEVHEIAEQLEHIHSDKLIERLDDFLGNPEYDPHGDPIPDRDGNLAKDRFILLSKAETGKSYVVTGVSDHSAEFLKMLDKWTLSIGTEIQALDRVSFDGSLEILIHSDPEKTIFLSQKSASNILVRP